MTLKTVFTKKIREKWNPTVIVDEPLAVLLESAGYNKDTDADYLVAIGQVLQHLGLVYPSVDTKENKDGTVTNVFYFRAEKN